MNFNYTSLSKDLRKTFVFGDTLKGKAKEIGIKTHQLDRLKENKPVSVEIIMKCFQYLIAMEGDIPDKAKMGYYFDKYTNDGQ
jgi:hypothetical protein